MDILRFDKTTIEDLHIYGLTNIINEIFDFMGTEIDKGSVIVIERRYSNAQPEIVWCIRTLEELQQFKNNY